MKNYIINNFKMIYLFIMIIVYDVVIFTSLNSDLLQQMPPNAFWVFLFDSFFLCIYLIAIMHVLTHIPHFEFIKMQFCEFLTAMNQLNKVSYTDLHSYCRWHFGHYSFFLSFSLDFV